MKRTLLAIIFLGGSGWRNDRKGNVFAGDFHLLRCPVLRRDTSRDCSGGGGRKKKQGFNNLIVWQQSFSRKFRGDENAAGRKIVGRK